MRRRLFLTILVAGAVCAQSLPTARQLEIEKLIGQEMAQQNMPAVSVAVAAGGELLWSNGYGMADLENYVPAKASTMYRTGSIAKPITAVAVMQLAEAGKIDLDAVIQRYVPAFPAKSSPVTVRQLLGHLGGIRHYESLEEVNSTRHYTDMLAAIKIFQNDPLVAEPGTRFHYTTYGYVLLGLAVEKASSLRFNDYLRQRVFAAAGMESTRQDHVYAIIPNRARGYAFSKTGQLQNCSLADTSNKIPGGGLISNAADLVRFALALRRGALVSKPANVEAMFTPQRMKDGKTHNYGLGWSLDKLEGRKLVAHTGGQQGVSTIVLMLPKEGVAVSLMSNLERANLRELARKIARVLLEIPPRELTRNLTAR